MTLLRAAAKNHGRVVILSDPKDYDEFLSQWKSGNGTVSEDFRRRMAVKVCFPAAGSSAGRTKTRPPCAGVLPHGCLRLSHFELLPPSIRFGRLDPHRTRCRQGPPRGACPAAHAPLWREPPPEARSGLRDRGLPPLLRCVLSSPSTNTTSDNQMPQQSCPAPRGTSTCSMRSRRTRSLPSSPPRSCPPRPLPLRLSTSRLPVRLSSQSSAWLR